MTEVTSNLDKNSSNVKKDQSKYEEALSKYNTDINDAEVKAAVKKKYLKTILWMLRNSYLEA